MIDRTTWRNNGRTVVMLLSGLSALAWLGIGSVVLAQDAAPAGAPTAEPVLRRTTDFFKKARSVSVEVERVQKVGEMTIPSKLTIAIERPNRFAIRSVEG